MKSEKHEFLYSYARAAFDDELQRFRNIEDKSAKYLSLLSVGIVAYTIILRFYSAAFFPAENLIQWITCIVVSVTYLAFASSWSFLYRALRFREMPRLPLDDKFIENYEPESLATIQFALTKTCSEALKYARKGNAEKSELLIKSYKDIAFAMWSLTVSVILIVSLTATIEREKPMSGDNNQESQSQPEPSSEPNRDVPPPEVTFVLDHAIPEIEKGGQQINESGRKDSGK